MLLHPGKHLCLSSIARVDQLGMIYYWEIVLSGDLRDTLIVGMRLCTCAVGTNMI